MRVMNRFVFALCLLGLFTFVGCSSFGFRQGPPFNLGYTAPKEEPVFIENVRFDDVPVDYPGILSFDWKRVGQLTVLAPPYPPFPNEVFVRWFNYKQQRFYEATVPLKENAFQIYRDLPKPQYGRKLIVTGVLPDGQAVVWVANAKVARFGTWIEVGRMQGRQVEGDPDQHRNTTAEMREHGEI
jgi:hypothetical protein